jgi:cell division protein FtsQ
MKNRDGRVRIRVFLILIAVISLFVFLNFKTDFFNVKSIVVVDNSQLTIEQIQVASGAIGENIFALRQKDVKANLELHPYIKQAEVSKKYPSGLKIEVIERREVLEIKDGDTYVYVDEDGKVLKVLAKPLGKKLPILKGPTIQNYEIGDDAVFENQEAIQTALSILGEAESLGYLEDVDEIVIKGENDLIIRTNLGINVAFGEVDAIKYKISFIHEILEELEANNINSGTLYLNKGKNPVFVPQSE